MSNYMLSYQHGHLSANKTFETLPDLRQWARDNGISAGSVLSVKWTRFGIGVGTELCSVEACLKQG